MSTPSVELDSRKQESMFFTPMVSRTALRFLHIPKTAGTSIEDT